MLNKTYNKQVNIETLKREIQNSSITIAIESISTLGNQVTVTFKAHLDTAAESVLDSLVSSHVYISYQAEVQIVKIEGPKTTTGFPVVSMREAEGGAATIVSHNFADKTSWYQGSVQVIGGNLINWGTLVYSDPNNKTHWIDLENGKLYDEDNVMAAFGNKFKVKVYVDSVQVTSGFTINYEVGTITFNSAITGVVTASYCYAGNSYFSVRPRTGKVLSIQAAEVQFCQGITLPSPFIFAPWFVGHPTYGTMEIPGQQLKYKNFKDFISACNEGQGLIPRIGDIQKDVHIFPFNYARPKPIKHSEYVEIRVYCANHTSVNYEPGGQYATVTFYVTIDDQAI